MKNIFKLIGIFSLICFSFFYTDKVITVVNEQDPIMIKLKEISSNYQKDEIKGVIEGNTIIPGVNGKIVNIKKSYQLMREIGIFDEKYLVYDVKKTTPSLEENKDKFIISGNKNNKNVSIVFTIDNDNNINKTIEILNSNNITSSFFIDYTYLNNNLNNLRTILKNHEVYSMGNNLEYIPDVVLFSNNLINRTFNNKAIYCLSTNYNIKTLNTCSNLDIFTIDTIQEDYNNLTKTLSNGNIIYLDIKKINELELIIKFIKGKGYNIIPLTELLKE